MKILYTSDIHASDNHLFAMLETAEREEVEVIIIGGDIVPHYLYDTARHGMLKAQAMYLENIFITEVKAFKTKWDTEIYLDLGNDDFIYNRKLLKEYDNDLIHLLHFRKAALTDDVDIIGYMNVPPTPFKIKDSERPDSGELPYPPDNRIAVKGYISVNGLLEEAFLDLDSEDTIEKELNELSKIIDRPFIFVSHSPPYNTLLDVIYNGTNVGSIGIRRFIERWVEEGLLLASFHGHIHESPFRSGSILDRIGNIPCINPGQGNGKGSEFRYIIFRLTGGKVVL